MSLAWAFTGISIQTFDVEGLQHLSRISLARVYVVRNKPHVVSSK